MVMVTTYVNSAGCCVRYPSAYLALLNWFVDGTGDDIPLNVASGSEFVSQMLTAVESYSGKKPRIDFTASEEEQYADILRYIYAVGGITKLKIK